MKRNNRNPRKSDKDVFMATKLKNANFNTGFYQIPAIKDQQIIRPDELILWSKRNNCKCKEKCGLIFYEYDCNFDGPNGIYNILKYGSESKILKLIDELKQFAFVVCPDYSVYGNFPNYKQIEALSKSREVGYILSTYEVKVIINYRATHRWTYELALSGMEKNQTIAIGTLGALREKGTRKMLKNSIDALIKHIEPKKVLIIPSDVKVIGGTKTQFDLDYDLPKNNKNSHDVFYRSFSENDIIEEVYMDDNVIEIGDKAFEHCHALRRIRFSNNLKKIGYNAFLGCEKLEEVILPKSVKILTEGSFELILNLHVIYEGDLEDYGKIKADDGWTDKTTRITTEGEDLYSVDENSLRKAELKTPIIVYGDINKNSNNNENDFRKNHNSFGVVFSDKTKLIFKKNASLLNNVSLEKVISSIPELSRFVDLNKSINFKRPIILKDYKVIELSEDRFAFVNKKVYKEYLKSDGDNSYDKFWNLLIEKYRFHNEDID